jgi:hypothetical protein
MIDDADGYDAAALREERDGRRPPRKTKGSQGQG